MKSKPIITIPFLKLAYLIGRKKIKPLTHTVSLGKMSEEDYLQAMKEVRLLTDKK